MNFTTVIYDPKMPIWSTNIFSSIFAQIFVAQYLHKDYSLSKISSVVTEERENVDGADGQHTIFYFDLDQTRYLLF